MKKNYLIAILSLSLLIGSNRILAQDTGTNLNQVELIKQFINSWKGEIGKDTTALWEIKSNGTGLECNFKYVTKDKVIMEGKQLWDYDKKVDKFILTSATGMDNVTSSLWFTSKTMCLISFGDASNSGGAPVKLENEFKSPDLFIQKTIVNNKPLKTVSFYRVKN